MVWICLLLLAVVLHRLRKVTERVDRLEAECLERSVTGEIPIRQAPAAPSRASAEPEAIPVAEAPPALAPSLRSPEPAPSPPSRPAVPRAAPSRAPAFQGLELALGTRWSVWGGALLLAIGSVFLIRWGIERGMFGPEARVAAAAAFGFLVAGAGEWLRRRTHLLPRMPAGTPDIPALLTGVGSLAVFGAIYAAHALYGLIGPASAFLLLALAGAATMAASLLHGQALAGLGLLGALATPLLVAAAEPNPWTIVLYAPVVVATAHAFAWYRGWRGLAVAASVGGFAWSLLLALDTTGPMAPPLHALLQALLAGWTFGVVPYKADAPAEGRGVADAVTATATAILLALLAQTGMDGAFGAAWVAVGLAGIAIPAFLASTRRAFRIHAGHAALAAFGLALAWPSVFVGRLVPYLGPDAPGLRYARAWPDLTEPGWFVAVMACVAAGLAALALRPVLRGEDLRGQAAHGTALAVAVLPPALLAFAWYRMTRGEPSGAAALAALATAGLYVVPIRRLDRLVRARPTPTLRYVTGAVLTAMVACACLALAFALSGNALTACLAIAAVAAARLSSEYRSEALRWSVAALAAVVALRIAHDPLLAVYGLSGTPILNGLLVAYAVPAIAFAYAGQALGWTGREDAPVIGSQTLALVLAVAGSALEIRHLTHEGVLRAGQLGLLEAGLYVTGAYGAAIALARLCPPATTVARIGALAVGMLGHVAACLLLGFALNPIVTGWPVRGGLILGDITVSYGLNVLMALCLVRALQGRGLPADILAARLAALFLAFVTVNLYVRNAFQGASLGMMGPYVGPIGQDELYAYSAAWIALGIGFITYGIRFGSWPARGAGFALLAATVAKVFLVDMEGLDGVHRAAAFIGLGGVLMGVGFVYQRAIAPAQEGSARSP